MSPYAPTGAFTSRVLDAGRPGSDWSTVETETSLPAGTQVMLETRSGDPDTPDGTWSEWQAVGLGGTIASPSARDIQYRASLSTGDDASTPTLERVLIGYRASPIP